MIPEQQNKRIGTMLIEQLKQEADLKKIPLRIVVEKDNPRALRLYQHLGCLICDEDEKAYHLKYKKGGSE